MGREEYILQNFEHNFGQYKNKRIVLYGIGYYAQLILRNFADYNIVGVLDKYLSTGTIYGKKIYSYAEIVEDKIDIIIIACRKDNIETIRRRIANLAYENAIEIFSADGMKLDVSDGNFFPPSHPCHRIKEEEVLDMIMHCDVVIWGIYETLFTIIEDENLMIFPREHTDMLIKYCISLSKKVFLFDNMTKTNERTGVQQYLSEHLDNAELKILNLQEIQKLSASASRIGYIGYLDENSAAALKKHSIQIYRFYSPKEMFMHSSYYRGVSEQWEVFSGMLPAKLFVAKAFSSPFSLEKGSGKKNVSSGYEMGYLFLGPILTDFSEWLVERTLEGHIDCMVFSARDGFLVQKMYDRILEHLNKSANTCYLLTSRLLCIAASLLEEADIEKAVKINFFGSPEEMLMKRFQLSENDIEPFEKNGESLMTYVLRHEEKILKRSRYIRESYIRYLKKFDFQKYDRIGFFDLLASGTCQNTVSKLLNLKMKGFYFIRFDSDDEKKKELTILPYSKWREDLVDHSLFMECILTSFFPPLQYMDDQPVYAEETRNSQELEFIADAQQGILDYLSDYLYCHGRAGWSEQNYELVCQLYGFVSKKYTDNSCEVFNNFILRDEVFEMNNNLENICRV